MQLWALQFEYLVPQQCATCSLCLWAAGCRGKVSRSASSGRGVHLCGFAAPRGDPDRTHPALLVEDTLRSSLLRTTKRKVTPAVPIAPYRRRCDETRNTFLSGFADDFNVFHGNFQELSGDE